MSTTLSNEDRRLAESKMFKLSVPDFQPLEDVWYHCCHLNLGCRHDNIFVPSTLSLSSFIPVSFFFLQSFLFLAHDQGLVIYFQLCAVILL